MCISVKVLVLDPQLWCECVHACVQVCVYTSVTVSLFIYVNLCTAKLELHARLLGVVRR